MGGYKARSFSCVHVHAPIGWDTDHGEFQGPAMVFSSNIACELCECEG